MPFPGHEGVKGAAALRFESSHASERYFAFDSDEMNAGEYLTTGKRNAEPVIACFSVSSASQCTFAGWHRRPFAVGGIGCVADPGNFPLEVPALRRMSECSLRIRTRFDILFDQAELCCIRMMRMKGRRFRVDPSILNAFRIESTRSGSLSPVAWTGFHGIPSGPMRRYNDESRIGTTAVHRRNRRDGAGHSATGEPEEVRANLKGVE